MKIRGQPSRREWGIWIVDDHPLIVSGLRLLFQNEADFQIAGCASNGLEACRSITRPPDLIIMDIKMPKMDGIRATERLLHSFPKTRVLALTACSDPHSLSQMIRAGAAGCLLKSCDSDELVHALRELAYGRGYFGQTVLDRLPQYSPAAGSTQDRPPANNRLSFCESQVLIEIAHGLTTKEIAAKFNRTPSAIEKCRVRMSRKLNLHGCAQLVRHAFEEGWVSPPSLRL